MDRSFFNRFVYRGKSLREEFFCFFAIFIYNSRSYGFYARSQNRLVFSVDQVAAKGSSLLPYRRHGFGWLVMVPLQYGWWRYLGYIP